MKTELMTVTPDIAREWLKKNHHNRAVVKTVVERYARDMTAGEWKVTHQGIAFAPDGSLLDGQHRLMAIVASGVTIITNVTQGVSDEAFIGMDGGKSRTLADRLVLFKDPEANRLAVAFIVAYAVATHKFNGRPTADETDDLFLELAEGITTAVHTFKLHGKRKGLCRAAYGAALSVYIQKHPIQGKAFLERYFSGINLSLGDPVLTLREAIIQERIEESVYTQYWKTVGATHADAKGNKITKLVTATRDSMGNIYHSLEHTRREKGFKGMETRRARQASVTP
jgi:hypothetical protein